MNLLSMLTKTLTSTAALGALASKTGISEKQLRSIINTAVPVLVKKMTSNASSQEGAASLLGALGQHKPGKTVDKQLGAADEEDGSKIVGHILGEDKQKAVQAVAKETGASEAEVSQVLGNISPSVLSGLSAATNHASKQKAAGVDLSDGFDLNDVMGLLGGMTGGSGGSEGVVGNLMGALMGGGQKKQEQKKDHSADGTELINSLLSMMK